MAALLRMADLIQVGHSSLKLAGGLLCLRSEPPRGLQCDVLIREGRGEIGRRSRDDLAAELPYGSRHSGLVQYGTLRAPLAATCQEARPSVLLPLRFDLNTDTEVAATYRAETLFDVHGGVAVLPVLIGSLKQRLQRTPMDVYSSQQYQHRWQCGG